MNLRFYFRAVAPGLGALLLGACAAPSEPLETEITPTSSPSEARGDVPAVPEQTVEELAAARAENTTYEKELADALLGLDDSDSFDIGDIDVATAGGTCDGEPRLAHAVSPYPVLAWVKAAPLRCGYFSASRNQGWGWRKLKAKKRWNVWFKGMISVTLGMDGSPKHVDDPRGGPGMWLFQTPEFTNCPEPYRFKVFVSRKDVANKKGLQMQGVLNAYQDFTGK